VPPAEAQEWYEHWQRARMDWYLGLGLREDHLRLREHEADEAEAEFYREMQDAAHEQPER